MKPFVRTPTPQRVSDDSDEKVEELLVGRTASL
jgi:hypothetical protein